MSILNRKLRRDVVGSAGILATVVAIIAGSVLALSSTAIVIKQLAEQAELNAERTYFCGAYWRNGFHEDGVVSALEAVRHFEERLEREELYLRRAG